MDDEPSRLQLLRFARGVVVQQATAALAQLDGWIEAEERREAERCRGEEMRPPPSEWLIQHGLNRTNVDAVHTGECWAAAKSGRCRPVTRQQALEAPRQQVPSCVHCRPDTDLGLLDQLTSVMASAIRTDRIGPPPLAKCAPGPARCHGEAPNGRSWQRSSGAACRERTLTSLWPDPFAHRLYTTHRDTGRRAGSYVWKPDWIVELGIGAGNPPTLVHVGGCYAVAKRRRPVDRNEARRLLPSGLATCTRCRPNQHHDVLE